MRELAAIAHFKKLKAYSQFLIIVNIVRGQCCDLILILCIVPQCY